MDGDDAKKRKRATPQDAPDQKPKSGFSNLTKLGNTRTKEIAKKKRRIGIETEEAIRRLEAAVRRVSSARIGSAEVARVDDLLDQPKGEENQEEEVKKATGEEEEEAQSDHSMTGAGSSDENGGQNY